MITLENKNKASSTQNLKSNLLTDRRNCGRFTADLQDFKFLFDSMPQVEAHRITILSLTVKRKKERKPQGNSQQDIMKEVTIRS